MKPQKIVEIFASMRGMKLCATILLLCAALQLSAQDKITVESFRLLENDLTANIEGTKRIDLNTQQPAALIKVVTSETGFHFDGGLLGIIGDNVQRVGEIWVYVPPKSKKISIHHQQYGVLRDYYYPIPIEAGRTYEMVLKMSKAEKSKSVSATPVPVEKPSEHLVFKGVPIDGTLSEYAKKMESAGFRCINKRNGEATLRGDFAGFKDCTIQVSTLQSVDVVSTIDVAFPAREDWASLEGDYNHLKSMLSQKYGRPAKVVERFTSSYPESDDDKWTYFHLGKYIWYAIYNTTKGDIKLFLKNSDNFGSYGLILLKYTDKINNETVRAAAVNDL